MRVNVKLRFEEEVVALKTPRHRVMLCRLAAALLSALAIPGLVSAETMRTLVNGAAEWKDTAGQPINCHCGGILVDGDTYWWYGEHRDATRAGHQCHTGIRCYSSKDLVSWTPHGVVLAVDKENLKSDIADGCMMERPKVLRSRTTGRYVMYFHQELRGQYYSAARTGVAVADRPEGPFRYVKGMRPDPKGKGEPQMARDMTLFQDDDGRAYHVFSSEDNATLHILELKDDLLGYTGRWHRILPDEFNEAPAIVKHDGWYHLVTSGTTGWDPNPARLHRARRLDGPWESLGNPCRGRNPVNGRDGGITWGGQSSQIFPLIGKPGRYAALFDILHEPSPDKSRYIIVPVDFDSSGRLFLEWQDKVAPHLAGAPMDDADYLRRKWQEDVTDPSTGMDLPAIGRVFNEKVPVWKKEMSWPAVKAKMVAFMCDNVSIGVSEHDWFPAFAPWSRDFEHKWRKIDGLHPMLDQMLKRDWEVTSAHMPKVCRGERGAWNMYRDFDHSAPCWEDILKLGFPGMLKRLEANWKDDEFHRVRKAAGEAVLRLLDRLIAQGEKKVKVRGEGDGDGAGWSRMEKQVASLKRLRAGAPQTALDAMNFIYVYWVVSEVFESIQVRTLGNIDRLLTPYYRADLAAGRTTEAEFREQFAHFWWQWGSMDYYWGQPVFVGGTEADGSSVYSEVSKIILDVVDELALPTPKLHLKMG